MFVMLKRPLHIEGQTFEPNAVGTEIPDQIGDKKVELWTPPEGPPAPAEGERVLLPNGAVVVVSPPPNNTRTTDPTKTIILPKDVVLSKNPKPEKEPPPPGVVAPGARPQEAGQALSQMPVSTNPAEGPHQAKPKK